MRKLFSEPWNLASVALGAAVFFVLIWWLARVHSHMWRLASARYAGRATSARIATKAIDTIVITARGSSGPLYTGNMAYRVYPGVKITIHEDGLALSLIPPLNIMCPPMYLPFDEMHLEQTYWALWPEPFAIRMQALSDVDIILGRDTVQWLRSGTDRSPFSWEA